MDYDYHQPPKNNRRFFSAKRMVLFLLLALFLAGTGYGGFFVYKFYSVGKKISIENDAQPSFIQTVTSLAKKTPAGIKSADPDRINILLLGIAGKGKPGQYLTDTIMIMSVNQKTRQVAFLSIPRDLYVSVPDTGLQRKINTVYQFGLASAGKKDSNAIDPLLKVVKNITSLDIDYYAVLNFDGFQKLIDDIGGINITNEKDLYDARYPGPNYSYETFELKKGVHHLDGSVALQYARERHNDPQGDFGRARRQQQIMQAAKNKIFSATTLFNPVALNSLLNTLGNNVITNITSDEIAGLLELSRELDTQNIGNAVLDAWNKDSLLKIVHIDISGQPFSVLVPRVGNWSEIQELAQNIFDLEKIKRGRDEIAREDANVAIINKSGNNQIAGKIKKLLSVNLDYKNVTAITSAGKILEDTSTVFDFTDGTKPFTANELVTKLPAVISYETDALNLNKNRGNSFDMVVIIGKDLTSKYNMEEGTIEDLNKDRDNQESVDFIKN